MGSNKYTKDDIQRLKELIQEIKQNAENKIQHPLVDEQLLNNIQETIITLKVKNDLGEALNNLLSNSHFVKTMTGFHTWKEFHQDKFKKSVKTLKHIFKKNQTAIPTDWEKIFYDWYHEKYPEFKDTPIHLIPPMDENEIWNWANEFTKEFNEVEPEKLDTYKNLPHALCILDDLGILNLIDEKFNNKNYSGRARETDKAKLVATILKIDDAEKVRQALKNKDYLSDKAKNNAKKTLNDLGLKSRFELD